MTIINRIIGAITFGISFYKNPMLMQGSFMKLITNIFDLLVQSSESETPLASKIVIFDGEGEENALTLWCCSGANASYIDRSIELKKENDELKLKLSSYENSNVQDK